MNGRRKGTNDKSGMEMTTFNEPNIRRTRSGSFTGSLDYVHEAQRVGYVDFSFSNTTGIFDVKTIQSNAPGSGREMMSRMESLARQNQATSMETATSRPGFFKKVGFDYTPQQKVINQHKYTQQELDTQEQNRGEGGGGSVFVKEDVAITG